MRLFHGTANAEIARPTVLTLGVYDGLHLGHQLIMRTVVERARAANVVPTVITFEPHPRAVLHPASAPPLLQTLDQKIEALGVLGIPGPGWLTDPKYALLSIALVDVWKGVGLATVIYMAGIVSIPAEYFEAARMDGASAFQRFRHIILPLARPATVTVIILSLIGGLRSFDLIWTMTRGGPGFTSDVIASVIYKQYQAGFYGLSTAGNVVLFLLVTAIVLPLSWLLNRREVQL